MGKARGGIPSPLFIHFHANAPESQDEAARRWEPGYRDHVLTIHRIGFQRASSPQCCLSVQEIGVEKVFGKSGRSPCEKDAH